MKKTTVTIIFVCVIQLFALRIVDSSCGQGTSSGTFLGGVRCPSQKIVASQGSDLLICGRPSCSVVMIVSRREKISALSLYRDLNVAGSCCIQHVTRVHSHCHGPNCSTCARRLFVDRLSSRRFYTFRRGLFHFPNFCIRHHAVQRCRSPYKTLILNSVKRISPTRIGTSSCCRGKSFVKGRNIRHTCRERLHKRGNIRVLLQSTQKHVGKHCVSKRLSVGAIPKGGLALNLSIELRALNRHLVRKGLNDVITVRPSANRVLYVISSPACSPHVVIKH